MRLHGGHAIQDRNSYNMTCAEKLGFQ